MIRRWFFSPVAAAFLGGFFVPAFADFEQEDVVCETTTHSGTGRTTVNLSGTACTNYLTFATGGVDDGDTVTVTIVASGGKIETGHATFNDAAPDTLTSYTVLASSDGVGTALNLSGTSNIYLQWNSHSYGGGVGVWDIDSLTAGNTGLTVGSSIPFSDSAGTLTFQNVDAIDATTESTFEGALDLPDLQGTLTVGKGGTGQTTEAEAIGELTQALTEDATTDADADFIPYYDGAEDTGNKIGVDDLLAPDVQTFTSSGTWNKPANKAGTAMVLIQAWGGGAGGGRAESDDGGGAGAGGGFHYRWVQLDDLGATETVTVGAGGAKGASDDSDGASGGNTTFGAHVTAYGGGYGDGQTAEGGGGGGGGDAVAAGTGGDSTSNGGIGGNVNYNTDFETASFNIGSWMYQPGMGGLDDVDAQADGIGGGGAGGGGGGGVVNEGSPGGTSFYGGGGGGGGACTTTADEGDGGSSVWGGGGGGGGCDASQCTSGERGIGGTSVFGGNGGDGNYTSNAAQDGTQPGGGGGGGSDTGTEPGDGADGQVVVYVF